MGNILYTKELLLINPSQQFKCIPHKRILFRIHSTPRQHEYRIGSMRNHGQDSLVQPRQRMATTHFHTYKHVHEQIPECLIAIIIYPEITGQRTGIVGLEKHILRTKKHSRFHLHIYGFFPITRRHKRYRSFHTNNPSITGLIPKDCLVIIRVISYSSHSIFLHIAGKRRPIDLTEAFLQYFTPFPYITIQF